MPDQKSTTRPRSLSSDMLVQSPPQSPTYGRPRTAHAFSTDRTLSHAMREQLQLNDLPKETPGNSPEIDSSVVLPPVLSSPWEYRNPTSPSWPKTPDESQPAIPSAPRNHVHNSTSSGDNPIGGQQGRGWEIFTPRCLPGRPMLSRCIKAFFKGYGTIFHFVQEVDIMDYFSVAYSLDRKSLEEGPESTLSNGEFCLMLLVAAVGAQYLDDDRLMRESRERLFMSGKWYLDIAFGRVSVKDNQSPKIFAPATTSDDTVVFLKMSASAITGLYLIYEKSMAAWDYIEQAIRLAQSRNLHMDNRNLTGAANAGTAGGGVAEYDWDSWRRVWKSLVFLDGWLSSSVGTRTATDLSSFADDHPPCNGYNGTNVRLQTEMANLGNLMSLITRDICAPKEFEISKVREYWNLLRAWHDGLPEFLRLSGALSDSTDYTQKTSVLLTHCAYLGSIMLLTRRVLVSRVRVAIEGLPSQIVRDMDEFTSMNMSAARQLAMVVGMMFQEGRLVRKCWLGIQSSFSSCLVILLDVALARREYNSQPSAEDSELLRRCIAALEYCAAADSIAKEYLELLLPIRDVLIPGPRLNPDRLQRPSLVQHRSSSYSSSASSPLSRSPSASPSKRPRMLPSRSSGSASLSLGNSPTYIGPSFQHQGSFNRVTTTNRMDQMFRSEDGVISGNDPRIHLLIIHILECIDSPREGDRNISDDHVAKKRYIELKSKMPNSNSVVGLPPLSTSWHDHHNHNPISTGQSVQQQQHRQQYQHQRRASASRRTVASSGGPLPNVWVETAEDHDVGGGRRRKMPFNSMEEYENFLRRVA